MRKDCDTCIRDEFGDYCKHCEWSDGKPPSKWKPVVWWTPDTNADRIRAMSDEELEDFLLTEEWMCDTYNSCSVCPLRGEKGCISILEWLKQPVETENADRCVCCGAIIPEGSMVCTNCNGTKE